MTLLSELLETLRSHESIRQIAISALLVLITAVVTHLFDVRKIREQQKVSIQDSIEKRTIDACLAVRDLLLEGRKQEIFQVERISTENFQESISNTAWYPGFATDRESFLEYSLQITKARELSEPYLSAKSTAYLFVYERYFLELAHLIGTYKCYDKMQLLGAIIMADVQKIQKDFDDVLIKDINRPRQFLESKNTRRYKKLRKVLWTKYIEQSILMKIKKDEETRNLLCDHNTPGYTIVNRVSTLCFEDSVSKEQKQEVTTP